MNWRQLLGLFADLWAAVRPEAVAARVFVALLRWHRPEDVGGPGSPRPYCLWCKTDWPRAEFIRLSDARNMATKGGAL